MGALKRKVNYLNLKHSKLEPPQARLTSLYSPISMGHNNSPTSILIVKIGVDYTKFHPIVNLISTLNIVLKVLIVFLED